MEWTWWRFSRSGGLPLLLIASCLNCIFLLQLSFSLVTGDGCFHFIFMFPILGIQFRKAALFHWTTLNIFFILLSMDILSYVFLQTPDGMLFFMHSSLSFCIFLLIEIRSTDFKIEISSLMYQKSSEPTWGIFFCSLLLFTA